VSRWWIGLGLLLLLAACARSSPTPAPALTPGVWFVEVDGEGGYWLGAAPLETLGLDPQADDPPTLRLSIGDQEVPTLPLRSDDGWGVFFFAPDRATRHTQRTALRLETAVSAPLISPSPPLRVSPSPRLPLSASPCFFTLHLEQDTRYLPQAEVTTPWFWEPLYAPQTVTHTLFLTDALPGPLTVTLRLWSHTASPANPDHRLRLRWDGAVVGEWQWDGVGVQELTASWEGTGGEEHALSIETPSVEGVDVAVVWLDGWDVTYPRRVRADGTVWQAEGSALAVESAPPGARLLDVTAPQAVLDLGLLPADGAAATVPGHRYWLGVPQDAPAPLVVRPALAVDAAALELVDYLVLAPPAFQPPLQPLLEQRRAQGLTVAVVAPQAVYDRFGAGQPDPAALRALVQGLPALRYLLVVGDASVEPGGSDGAAGALRVVAPLTRTTNIGETPADGLLGMDEQGQPLVAVGRFPASSPDDVAVMVERTLRWEALETPPTVLLVSDNEPEFPALNEEIGALLPAGLSVQRVSSGDEGSRDGLLGELAAGPAWLSFVGHGSLTRLCDESILTIEDGAAFRQPTVVVAWTCLAAHFAHPTQESLAEVWLRAPRGGVVAFLGPVGETTTGEQGAFAQAFYRALPSSDHLGDAWLAALQAGASPDVRHGYVLLGDPALRVSLIAEH